MDNLVTPEEKTEENSMYRRMLRVPRITSKYNVYEKKSKHDTNNYRQKETVEFFRTRRKNESIQNREDMRGRRKR